MEEEQNEKPTAQVNFRTTQSVRDALEETLARISRPTRYRKRIPQSRVLTHVYRKLTDMLIAGLLPFDILTELFDRLDELATPGPRREEALSSFGKAFEEGLRAECLRRDGQTTTEQADALEAALKAALEAAKKSESD
ncbi:hypothetical protein AB0C34_18140 [Nocardia sp. NPDC049220]|uniref:hypothetical protein n=1 Tax=Nocardia sp. NPDC049220 TaxID=3155273 RepID=UPI0033FE8A50